MAQIARTKQPGQLTTARGECLGDEPAFLLAFARQDRDTEFPRSLTQVLFNRLQWTTARPFHCQCRIEVSL